MEEKINIAEILNDKKNGLRLYSPIFGECAFCCVRKDTNDICVKKHNGVKEFFDPKGFYYNTGEVMLFPSKEMRDWGKFSWKKGDLLINSCGFQCIFKEWSSDDYTKFNGCYSNSRDGYEDVSNAETAKFVKLDNNVAYEYVREIERKLGGILNLETLEIEKAQPEFKDGDIVCISSMGYLAYGIVKSINNSSKKLEYYVLNDMSTLKFEDWLSFEDKQIQPITETQQIILFDALARENKDWDSDKKAIVDLKPKWTPKPFDKVITRVHNKSIWTANIFSHIDQHGKYVTIGCISGYTYCLPYNDETSHLIGTTDEWKGGEQ